jgi:hypothetical protein
MLIDDPDLFPVGSLIGAPDSLGPALSLTEVPGAPVPPNQKPDRSPILGIGTATGLMILFAKAPGPPEIRLLQLSDGPILSLTAVPDPAGAAILALASVGPGGGCIFGVDPAAGAVLYEAEVPGPSRLTSISYPISDLLQQLGTRQTPQEVVYSSGTGIGIAEFDPTVEKNDQIIKFIRKDGSAQVSPGKTQVVTGSIAVVQGDGSGVLYNPAFRLETGQVSLGLTVAGASMELLPSSLNVKSGDKFVTAVIEVDNMGALDILPETVTLVIGDARIAAGSPPAALGDEDLDGNPDLSVYFSRDEVLAAFEHGDPDAPVVVGALWNNRDGSKGRASTVVRRR